MIKTTAILAVLCLSLGACNTAPEINNEIVDTAGFIALLDRNFETAAENTENKILDRRIRVTSDALDGYWFYTQLNTGDARKLYRQRLSNVSVSADGTAIIQTAYGLNTPETFANAWENPDRLAALSQADFKPYFQKGCEQVWRPDIRGGWTGYVDPKTCIITSKRRNKDIRIESEAYLSKDVYRTNERGYDLDMTFLWGTKPGEKIELYPIP